MSFGLGELCVVWMWVLYMYIISFVESVFVWGKWLDCG